MNGCDIKPFATTAPVGRLLITMILISMAAGALSHGEDLRLAVLSQNEKQQPAADLLAAELSRQTNLVMLERDQIAKVRSELALSAASKTDYVKLGQLMGADGLLILASDQQGTNEVLTARLLAVKPGVVLRAHSYPWPLQDMMEWSRHTVDQFQPIFPKLAVLPKNAVPISVVSLRSALQSAESRETERELTELLIARLTKEPDIFVLEREHLREASEEKQFAAIEEDSSFWAGRYLLEGTLDKEGFDPEKLTINAKLGPAKGGDAVSVELSGPRKNLPATVEDLTQKILAGLHRNAAVKDWSANAEADKYFQEARWSRKWGLKTETQQACEAAWALGNHTRENGLLLVEAYMDDPELADSYFQPWLITGWDIKYDLPFVPEASCLSPVQRALEFFDENAPNLSTNTNQTDYQRLDLELKLLEKSGRVLAAYYHAAEARSGHEEQLAEIRALTRRLVTIIETQYPSESSNFITMDESPLTLNNLKWRKGGYWFETPEDALQMQRKLLEQGRHPSFPPWVAGWSATDRKHVPGLVKAFVEEAARSTNPVIRLDGLLMRVARAPIDEFGEYKKLQNELFEAAWPERHHMFQTTFWHRSNGNGTQVYFAYPSLYGRIETVIKTKYKFLNTGIPCAREPYGSFINRVRRDYLKNLSSYDNSAMSCLFPPNAGWYTETDAQEFLSLLKSLDPAPLNDGQRNHIAKTILTLQRMTEPQAVAGDRSPRAPKIDQVAPSSSGSNIVIHFMPLDLQDANPGYNAVIHCIIYRQGKLWFQVRYQGMYSPANVPREDPVLFVKVDPLTGSQETIRYPGNLEYPDPQPVNIGDNRDCFEITADSLYVSSVNQIQRYRFSRKEWETIPVPIEQGATFLEMDQKLYLNSGDTILELYPDSQKIKVLASSRRRPAENLLDRAGRFKALFPGIGKGLITVVAQGETVYSFNLSNGACEKTKLYERDVNPERNFPTHIPTETWFRIRYEKDGKMIDISRKPENYAANVFRKKEFACKTPVGLAQASVYYPGYWFIPKSLMSPRKSNVSP